MIYIKLEDELKECNERFKFFNRKFLNFKNKFSKLKEDKFDNIILITLPNIENYTLNKLSKYIKTKCINRVCLSEDLMNKDIFMEFIKNEKVKIFDGKWLFKHLLNECIEYICNNKKEKIMYQEISILSNNIDKFIIDNVMEIAPKVRVFNIVTQKESLFKKIEKQLYEEKGIILNIGNNYKKSLSKSDIIFNFDFSEEEINKYNFSPKSCIINLDGERKINIKSFLGINANFYEIQMPRKYLRNSLYLKNFNNSILYESYIYKNTNSQNIKKEIREDEISIQFLDGKNGRIRKNEYINLSKKITN